jgi:hypothetical protein
MKHIKEFGLFEAVIMPSKIEDDAPVNSFESAVEFGQRNGFEVVDYDEFYDSLGEADKRTAPPRRGMPFFALFHPIRKTPMFVLTDPNATRIIPNFKEVMLDIIGHEMVHSEQLRRRGGIEFALPDPLDRKAYFSNKEEIMAFSFTIANDLAKTQSNPEEAMEELDRVTPFSPRGPQYKMVWDTIRKTCDEKTIRRYRKYIYMYLIKMLN